MMKNLEISQLFDIYGKLLTDRQRVMIAGYYDDDLSLGEIAENCGVTRQAVRDTIKKAEKTLAHYESILGVCRMRREIDDCLKNVDKKTREDISGILNK